MIELTDYVKMAIFYLAFFPQFVHPDRSSQVAQILILRTVSGTSSR